MRLTPDQQARFLDIIRRYPGRTASELKDLSPKVKWLVDRGGLRELESMRLIRYVPRGGSVAGGWKLIEREEV